MLHDLSEKQKHALWSFIELLCGYFEQKRLSRPRDPDRNWFIENRQRIHCLNSTPGPEEKFAVWFDSLENGDESVWAWLLSDLSDAKVSGHMYEAVKKYSPLTGKLILVRKSFDGEAYLSRGEGWTLVNEGVFPVDHGGDTLIIFLIKRENVIYPRG